MLDEIEGGFQAFLRRQAARLAGMGLLAAVAAGLAALATWNVADPSFSHATDNPVTNALGFGGAVFADLAMQFFGLASVAALVPAVLWGILLATARGVDRKGRRGAAWAAAAVLGAGMAGCVEPPPTWPLPSGLGGVFGDMALKLPSLVLGGYPSGVLAILVALLLALPALPLFAYGCGLLARSTASVAPRPATKKRPKQEEIAEDGDDDQDGHDGFAALGALAHWWLTARFFVRRMAARHARAGDREAAEARPGGWRAAAERVESAERAENRISESGRARIEPEFFATMVAGHGRAEPDMGDLDESIDDDVEDDPAALDLRMEPRRTASGGIVQSFRSPPGSRVSDVEPDIVRDIAPAMPAAAPRAMAPEAPARVEAPAPRPQPGARVEREAQTSFIGSDTFEMPSLHFLSEPKSVVKDSSMSKDALEQNARLLEGVLEDFGVKGEIIHVRPGPVVTLYELEPAPGIKSSRVIGLADDIARSMSAIACRVAVVPGRNAIGIELPNLKRETVYLREILACRDFETSKSKLALALGKTINGEAVIVDIAKMPHVLVAGTTGSGKSVAINTMVLSLLYKMTPEQCRLIMIDPKMVELSVYDGIPHLLTPVVTDPKKAVVALKWTVREMEDRYRKMAKVGVRNIEGFNNRVAQAAQKGETITRTVQTGFDRQTGEAIYESEELDLKPFPFIVVIIDEVADLMMVAGKDIEGAVQRLGQMARAAGIHVVMATQRPSVDVITGTIKANFPTRMSFQVTSKIDSRTILGEQGAEQLLGMGDMLYMAGGGRIQRVHGPFVSDDEVEKVVAHLKLQGVPEYLDAIIEDDGEDDEDGPAAKGGGAGGGGNFDDSDDPYDQAVAIVLRDGKASTSYIQRRLGIGYNRAASIIEKMEKEGIVGQANHAGKREILVPTEDDKM